MGSSGNIGTDLLAKLRRSDVIDVGYVVGVVESDGLARARSSASRIVVTAAVGAR